MRACLLIVLGLVISAAGPCVGGAAEPKQPSAAEPAKKTAGRKTPAAGAVPSTPADAAPSDKAQSGTAPSAAKQAETKPQNATAIFAGGCFWCMEFAFEQINGVIDVESGYCGGTKATANYDQVHLGTTAHAEAIRVTFDPDRVSYDDLLEVFFDAHDPTQLNRQGVDEGRQYRSAIFFADDEQEAQAKAKIADLEQKRVFSRKIVTKLEALKKFYPAEDNHQDFARRNPYSLYIQQHAVPKAMRVRSKHRELIRKGE